MTTAGGASRVANRVNYGIVEIDQTYAGNSLPLDTFSGGVAFGGGPSNAVSKSTVDKGAMWLDAEMIPHVYRSDGWRPVASLGCVHGDGPFIPGGTHAGLSVVNHYLTHTVGSDIGIGAGQIVDNTVSLNEAGLYLVSLSLLYASDASGLLSVTVTYENALTRTETEDAVAGQALSNGDPDPYGGPVLNLSFIFYKSDTTARTISYAQTGSAPSHIVFTVQKLGGVDPSPITANY